MLRQLTRFPLGTLDDKVDVCSIFARMINDVWEKDPPQEEKEPEIITGPNRIVIEDYAPQDTEHEW